ncbi:MAG: LamG-like jellyroll fold domain-containing protein, partial [Leptospirales bacterium]
MNRGTGSFNNFQVKLSCAPAADFTMNSVVNSLPNGFTLHSPAPNPHTFALADWAKPVDIINEITSDLDGAYSITLTPSDVSYPSETVYFEDSPMKRVTITTTGVLAAGESYEIQNFTDKKEIASLGSSIWWAVNGDPYAFEISRQPAGQICAIAEVPFGTTSTVMALTVNCVAGYATSQSVNPVPESVLDYRMYQGKVTTVAGSVFTMGFTVHANTLYYSNGANFYSLPTGGGAPTTLITGGLSNVTHVVTDGTNIYFSDSGNNRVVKYNIGGVIADTFAMGTAFGTNFPSGLALDINRQILYVSIRGVGEQRIRRIDLLSGTMLADLSHADINDPSAIVLLNDKLYVANYGDNRIIEITNPHGGTLSTLVIAGVDHGIAPGTAGTFKDGSSLSAHFSQPFGITTDGNDLYIAETGNDRIRKINMRTDIVSTIAGDGNQANTDGTGVAASFNSPTGIAFDGRVMYVSSPGGIRKVTDNGLVGYWPLGSAQPGVAGNANDYNSDGATSLTGTWVGPESYGAGRNNESSGAGLFNVSKYVSTKDITIGNNTPFAISAWINPTNLDVNRGILGASNFEFLFRVGLDGHLQFQNWIISGATKYISKSSAGMIKINTWTHVAYVYRGAGHGGGRVYINGHDATYTHWEENIGAPIDRAENVLIGKGYNLSEFVGSIADVRIYKRALNEGEINELAQDADETLVGNSYNKSATGLLSHYRFDNANIGSNGLDDDTSGVQDDEIYDSGPLSHRLTNVGLSTASIGKDGENNGAYSYNGSTQYLKNISSNGLPEGDNPRTLCAWINPASYPTVGSNSVPAGYGFAGTNPDKEFGLALNSTGQIWHWTGSAPSIITPTPIPLNTWTHMCMDYDGGTNGTTRLYQNGKLVSSGNRTLSTNANEPLTVGARMDGALNFNGKVDDVRIYNNVLTADQIRQLGVQVPNGLVAHYDFNGDTKDVSGFGNDLIVGATSPTLSLDRFGQSSSYYFDSSDYFRTDAVDTTTLPLPTGSAARTQCAWTKVLTGQTGLKIISQWGGGGSRMFTQLRFDASTEKFEFATNPVSVSAPMKQSKGFWHHVCAVYDGGTSLKLYVNGADVDSASTGTILSTPNNTQLFVGSAGSNVGNRWKGDLDDVRVYNRALAQSEIQALAGTDLINYRFQYAGADKVGPTAACAGGDQSTGIGPYTFNLPAADDILISVNTNLQRGTAGGVSNNLELRLYIDGSKQHTFSYYRYWGNTTSMSTSFVVPAMPLGAHTLELKYCGDGTNNPVIIGAYPTTITATGLNSSPYFLARNGYNLPVGTTALTSNVFASIQDGANPMQAIYTASENILLWQNFSFGGLVTTSANFKLSPSTTEDLIFSTDGGAPISLFTYEPVANGVTYTTTANYLVPIASSIETKSIYDNTLNLLAFKEPPAGNFGKTLTTPVSTTSLTYVPLTNINITNSKTSRYLISFSALWAYGSAPGRGCDFALLINSNEITTSLLHSSNTSLTPTSDIITVESIDAGTIPVEIQYKQSSTSGTCTVQRAVFTVIPLD